MILPLNDDELEFVRRLNDEGEIAPALVTGDPRIVSQTLGLPHTRSREWLLDIEFRQREKAVHRDETAGESDELTWHEPKDADLAVWVTAVDNLGELRKARRQFQPLHLDAMAAAPPSGLVFFDRRLKRPPDFAFDDIDVPF